MREIVFATENPGKLREINLFAQHYGVEVKSPSQAGLQAVSVEEIGTTYEENAALKVEAYLTQPGAEDLIICGDDSGIEFDALGGEPGIHSRRWIGRSMTDQEIIDYSLERMKDVPEGERTARFRSTLAYSLFGKPVSYVYGELEGFIRTTPLEDAPIQEGFPFRSLFVVSGKNELPLYAFDALSPDERAGMLSHRESAFKQLFQLLEGDEDVR
jgi:XTP/dITP diphosphohydrolase